MREVWTAAYYQDGEMHEVACESAEAAADLLLSGEATGDLAAREVLSPDGSVHWDDEALRDPARLGIDQT